MIAMVNCSPEGHPCLELKNASGMAHSRILNQGLSPGTPMRTIRKLLKKVSNSDCLKQPRSALGAVDITMGARGDVVVLPSAYKSDRMLKVDGWDSGRKPGLS
jgi:hypothetical protein